MLGTVPKHVECQTLDFQNVTGSSRMGNILKKCWVADPE